MSELIQLAYGFSVRAHNDEKRSVEVVASSEAIDAYGEIVVQDWDLKRYKANPVVLYGHNSWSLPIGHASDVRIEDGKLLATLNFVDARANPQAEQVWQGILQGSLRAVSVGFRSKAAKSQSIGDRTVFVLSGNELIEISVVPIPANPEAVAFGKKSLDLIRALAERTEPKEKKSMSILVTLAAVLGMSSTASEPEVIDNVKSLGRRAESAEANTKKLLDAAGTDSVEKALGIIVAGKSAIAELGEEKKKNETLERAQIIAKAKEEKKLTPAQEKQLEGKSLDFVKGFIELQHPNPVLGTKGAEEPEHSPATLTWKGKTWDQLKPIEKHNLYFENRDLYEAMKAAAEA